MDKPNSSPAIDACDAMFATGEPTATDLIHARTELKKASASLQTKYDELAAKGDNASLSDDERDLNELELLDVEEKLIPFSARLERINLLLTSIKEVRTRALSLARTSATYADPGKLNNEKPELLKTTVDLASRVRNGSSATSAWQTRRKYEPVSKQYEELSNTTDSDRARELAAEILGLLKPVLLAKVSAHADVKIELCDAFISAAKKS